MVSGDRRHCFEFHGPQRGQNPPLSQLQKIVGGADDAPFRAHIFQAPQQELAEAARLLDLPEHRFGQLLAQPVGAVAAAAFYWKPLQRLSGLVKNAILCHDPRSRVEGGAP